LSAIGTLITELKQQKISALRQPVTCSIDDLIAALLGQNVGLTAQASHPFQQPFGAQTAPATAQNGCVAMPVLMPAPMVLDSVTFRSGDSAGTHSIEFQVFYDTGVATLTPVPGASGTLTWSPVAFSTQRAPVSGAPPTLQPGNYWLILRVTGATATSFGQATNGQSGTAQVFGGQTKSLGTSIIGAAVDFSAGWTKMADFPSNYLNGRIAGLGTPWS
jgi:hypothetical protein